MHIFHFFAGCLPAAVSFSLDLRYLARNSPAVCSLLSRLLVEHTCIAVGELEIIYVLKIIQNKLEHCVDFMEKNQGKLYISEYFL